MLYGISLSQIATTRPCSEQEIDIRRFRANYIVPAHLVVRLIHGSSRITNVRLKHCVPLSLKRMTRAALENSWQFPLPCRKGHNLHVQVKRNQWIEWFITSENNLVQGRVGLIFVVVSVLGGFARPLRGPYSALWSRGGEYTKKVFWFDLLV